MGYPFFADKQILVTGGTGSFGRRLVAELLTHSRCGKLIVFSRDEWKQWEMKHSSPLFRDERLRYFLGDVRDLNRLRRAFADIDIVIHAAALKQVPAAEYNPSEFIKTNILGAHNLINAAIDRGVQCVIALSSDKAVNPVNLYGATKLCSDKLFIASQAYVGRRSIPRLGVVRYGNVLGSRGSIVQRWQGMMREGVSALPVTDTRMTRFSITLREAVSFVLRVIPLTTGGELFIPRIPSYRLLELVEAVAPGYPIEICGIRPGEKLHEVMIGEDDADKGRFCGDYYLLYPDRVRCEESVEGKPLPEGFMYTSNTNSEWLNSEALRALLKAEGLLENSSREH